MNKIKYCLGALFAIALLAGSAQVVLAEAGNQGGIHGGGCAPAGVTGTWWDTCFGATWRYYHTTEDSVYIAGTSHGTVDGGTVKGCGKYGGYYRLALEKYDIASGKSLGVQIGLLQNNKLRQYGGITNLRIESGSIGDSEARKKFNRALKENATNGFSWKEVSWFCFDPDWEEEEEPDPEEPEILPGSGDAEFHSTSSVRIPAQNGDVSSHQLTSDKDGRVTVTLGTDGEKLTVEFWHNIYYENNTSYASEDRFDNVSTNWNVSGANTSGTFSTNGKYNSSTEVSRRTVGISLAPGETKTVCHILSYKPKYVSFDRKDEGYFQRHYDEEGNYTGSTWVHEYYYFSNAGTSGSGSSRACVTVTRPEDPDGPGPNNPAGTTSSDVLYAGEDATVGWETNATSYGVRRYAASQAIVYLVPVNVNYYDGIATGEDRYRGGDTCTYYQGKASPEYCDSLYSESFSPGPNEEQTSFIKQASVTVPDSVGYKYCNSFGYQYQYWYAYNRGSGDEWHHDSSRDYWYVYDASCRPIAKKPSLATWNNSILSNGGVKTSTSPRYNPATMGTLASGTRTLYGSWTEYLNVIGGTVNGLTSGAALALGSSALDVYENSPLTIANNTTNLGSSGVQSSTALRTRLDTYLKNQDSTTDPGNTIGGAGWTNLTGTHVYHRQGDLNITGNITLATGGYNSVYQLPQVIIFVDGNVNISSNVTQIDAWIIAGSNSTINTCSDFQVGTTEADAVGRSSGTCTNQLVFNGPVMAGRLALNRSFGSDPLIDYRKGTFGANSDRHTPAEVFNYRADAYLWAYAQAGRYDSSYTETYTRELAPRY